MRNWEIAKEIPGKRIATHLEYNKPAQTLHSATCYKLFLCMLVLWKSRIKQSVISFNSLLYGITEVYDMRIEQNEEAIFLLPLQP